MISVYVLHVILSDVPIPIGGGLEAGHPDGMHAIMRGGFDVVKVLPLHEVERATAVKMIRYSYLFVRIPWIFDFTVGFANRTSNPRRRFLGWIVKSPKEIAASVDPMSGLITASFGSGSQAFCSPLCDEGRTWGWRAEAGRRYPEEVRLLNHVLRCLLFRLPLPRPTLMEEIRA